MYSQKLAESRRRRCPCNLKESVRVLPQLAQMRRVEGARPAVNPQLSAPYSGLFWGSKYLTPAICDWVDGAISLAFRGTVDGTTRELSHSTFIPKLTTTSPFCGAGPRSNRLPLLRCTGVLTTQEDVQFIGISKPGIRPQR